MGKKSCDTDDSSTTTIGKEEEGINESLNNVIDEEEDDLSVDLLAITSSTYDKHAIEERSGIAMSTIRSDDRITSSIKNSAKIDYAKNESVTKSNIDINITAIMDTSQNGRQKSRPRPSNLSPSSHTHISNPTTGRSTLSTKFKQHLSTKTIEAIVTNERGSCHHKSNNSSSASSCSSTVSPATQTLDVLSGIDAAGGGDLRYNNMNGTFNDEDNYNDEVHQEEIYKNKVGNSGNTKNKAKTDSNDDDISIGSRGYLIHSNKRELFCHKDTDIDYDNATHVDCSDIMGKRQNRNSKKAKIMSRQRWEETQHINSARSKDINRSSSKEDTDELIYRNHDSLDAKDRQQHFDLISMPENSIAKELKPGPESKHQVAISESTSIHEMKINQFVPRKEDLMLASRMHLPEGWSARFFSKTCRWKFWNTDGTETFNSKRAVLEFLSLDQDEEFLKLPCWGFSRVKRKTKYCNKSAHDSDTSNDKIGDTDDRNDFETKRKLGKQVCLDCDNISSDKKDKKNAEEKVLRKIDCNETKHQETWKTTSKELRKKPSKVFTDSEDLRTAKEMGLPEGWMARNYKNSRYTIWTPDKRMRFNTKKQAFHYLGLSFPPTKKNSNKICNHFQKDQFAGKKKQSTKKKNYRPESQDLERAEGETFEHLGFPVPMTDGSEEAQNEDHQRQKYVNNEKEHISSSKEVELLAKSISPYEHSTEKIKDGKGSLSSLNTRVQLRNKEDTLENLGQSELCTNLKRKRLISSDFDLNKIEDIGMTPDNVTTTSFENEKNKDNNNVEVTKMASNAIASPKTVHGHGDQIKSNNQNENDIAKHFEREAAEKTKEGRMGLPLINQANDQSSKANKNENKNSALVLSAQTYCDRYENSKQKRSTNFSEESCYTFHLIRLRNEGTLGMRINEGPSMPSSSCDASSCHVIGVREGTQAHEEGVKVNDIICYPPHSPHSISDDGTLKLEIDEQLEEAKFSDVCKWATSMARPVVFAVKRKVKRKFTTDPPRTNRILSEKEKKKVGHALKFGRFPMVAFCKKCNMSNSTLSEKQPHHSLCPKHPEFSESGAKERLTMILAGVWDGCKACKYELENGKKAICLQHENICKQSNESSKPLTKKENPSIARKAPAPYRTSSGRINEKEDVVTMKPQIRKRSKTLDNQFSPILTQTDTNNHKVHIPPSNLGCMKFEVGLLPTTKRKAKDGDGYPRSPRLSLVHRTDHGEKKNDKITSSIEIRQSPHQNSSSSGNEHRSPVNCITLLPTCTPDHETNDSSTPLLLTDDSSKPIWVPCQNPWGNRGHQDGDFVLVRHSDYVTHHEAQGLNPNRFTTTPFNSKSSFYHDTHVSPNMGYRVVNLNRDRLALRSWGFTFSYHEFGGACLVDGIEPFSPAEAAVDVGTLCGNEPNSAGLRLHDMIVCVNGKLVGGMTEIDLAIELDMCGPDLILVLSTFKAKSVAPNTRDLKTWETINDEKKLYWNEMGPISHVTDKPPLQDTNNSLTTSCNSAKERIHAAPSTDQTLLPSQSDELEVRPNEDNPNDFFVYENTSDLESMTENTHQYQSQISIEGTVKENGVLDSESLSGNDALTKTSDTEYTNNDVDRNAENLQNILAAKGKESVSSIEKKRRVEKWDEDENPWLGCDCGETHDKPIVVFWIQCDACDAWYNCSPDCVGFDENEAATQKKWECRACSPRASDYLEPTEPEIIDATDNVGITDVVKNAVGSSKRQTANGKAERLSFPLVESSETITMNKIQYQEVPTSDKMLSIIPIGTVVDVADRTWVGSNKPGGVAKLLDYRISTDDNGEGKVLYDVRYILGGREFNIESNYVSLNEHSFHDFSSPSTIRTRRGTKIL